MDNNDDTEQNKLSDSELLEASADFAKLLIMSTPKRILMLTTVLLNRFFSEVTTTEFAVMQDIEKSHRRKSDN